MSPSLGRALSVCLSGRAEYGVIVPRRVSWALGPARTKKNKIGEAGAAALAHALRVNGALTHLALKDNQIGEDSTSKLQEAVKGRSGFEFVDGL